MAIIIQIFQQQQIAMGKKPSENNNEVRITKLRE
jgi:hypothetical protein